MEDREGISDGRRELLLYWLSQQKPLCKKIIAQYMNFISTYTFDKNVCKMTLQ